jgi:hypothetical protein
MVNLGNYKETFKRAIDLNRRYYGSLGRATVDYLKELAAVLESVSAAADPEAGRAGPRTHETRGRDDPAPRAAKPAPVLVLEAEAGATAVGVFLVENNLPHPINARPKATALVDGYDRQIQPAITFEPAELALQPGEQMLVRILAVIDAALEPNIRYRGELIVQELPGTRIPIVIRRRDPATTS